MSKPRTFHRTEIRVVVLSERPFEPDSLADVAHAITEGDCSGEWDVTSKTELNGKECADALIAQASEPGYFRLNEDGTDAE